MESLFLSDQPLSPLSDLLNDATPKANSCNEEPGTAVFTGKIQFGSGWWFLDQLEGMTMQINALSHLGLLSRFVGMLTDSRPRGSF